MCIFCNIIEGSIPSKKVYEDENILAILDISQATEGHTLVLPKKHYDNILDIDKDTLSSLIEVVRSLSIKIVNNTGALGCNILNNCGEVSGQTVNHIHFHIIPRYKTDDLDIKFPTHELDLDEVLKKING